MSANQKSSSLMLLLQSHLAWRLPTAILTAAVDAQGSQLLVDLGSNEKMALRILSDSTPFVNSIGIAQQVFTPMIIQCIEEVGLISLAHRAQLEKEISSLGVIQQRYQNASGTHAALAQFVADGSVSGSTLSATVYPDVKWPLSGQ